MPIRLPDAAGRIAHPAGETPAAVPGGRTVPIPGPLAWRTESTVVVGSENVLDCPRDQLEILRLAEAVVGILHDG
jgi:hypothetical protein